jgi:hypothetical protein
MDEVQQYDIIELIKTDSVHIIGSFHSMVDSEILLFVPPTIQYIPKSDVTNISRLKRKDEYDSSKIEMFFKHSSFIFQKRYAVHDVLTIIFEDDTEIEGKITEIINDCITLQLESQENIFINFNYKTTIPLGILEIKRKKIHDLDEEEKEKEKNYTVVSYNIDESKCRYTLDIQLDAIVQYLNFIKLNGELYAQRYRELMLLFPYGTTNKPDQTNLSWIYPVTDAQLRIANNDIFKQTLAGTLMCYKKSLLTNKNVPYINVQDTYNSTLRVFDEKYSYTPTHIRSYLIPETVILKFDPKTASKEKDTNWSKKIQTNLTYVSDEHLPITQYTGLPSSSIPFSTYYLPETSLSHKVHLNMLSHYHLFNINCEPSFSYKNVDDYTTLIPTLDQLIKTPAYYSTQDPSRHPLPTTYSIYEFIHALEPYHIYPNHISNKFLPKIQSYIAKNIKTFLSKPPPTASTSTTTLSVNEPYQKIYVSSSELYAYALSQDSANTYIQSMLTPREKIDPLEKPSHEENAFILHPVEPLCELKKECSDDGPEKLKNMLLTQFHSSTVGPVSKLDDSLLHKKIKNNLQQLLKYNNKLFQLHSSLAAAERVPPTYEMFQQIMTYPLKKRYTTLLSFLTKYTTLDKSTRIFVCNTSNVPIVPNLFKMLADAYLTNIEEYSTILYEYCRSSSEIYIEDGFYKDKFTGLSLSPIENVHSYDELIRSAQIELEENAPMDFTPDQAYIEMHIQLIWKEITYKPLLTRHTLSVFINDMINQYNITEKTTKIPPNYLLSLLIYVFIQFRIPCDKIIDELAKNKTITEIDLGFIGNNRPFSFLSNLQKYTPVISKLCTLMEPKYTKPTPVSKLKRKKSEIDTSFMPYPDSEYPVLSSIKAHIQKSTLIHSLNGEIKRVNNAFIDDIDIPKTRLVHRSYHSYIQKLPFPPSPTIDFQFDITEPILIEPKKYPDLQEEYKTSEPLDQLKRQLVQMQKIIKDLSQSSVNEILKKYPPLYFANYIKTVLQFYATLNQSSYDSLKLEDVIPITHIHLIAPTHRESFTRTLDQYYKNFITNEKWGDLFHECQPILEELKQPLPESTKIILLYYLYHICKNLPTDVTQFVNTKLKSELNIPDYAEIKKRMTVRQSVERQNFVHTSRELSNIEKSLKSIIQTEITQTTYNIAQFTSRIEDALKADGDAGDKGDDGNDGEDGNDGGGDE